MLEDDVDEDPAAVADAVGLTHVDDGEPGIRRIRRGSGFGFRTPEATG